MSGLSACRLFLAVLAFECVVSSAVWAQYDLDRDYEAPGDRFVSAGFVWRDFQPRTSNPSPDSVAIRYTHVMPMIGFRQGLVDLTFGYTGYTLHGRSLSSVFFGATVANEFPLAGRRSRTAILIPVMISADYTKAESPGGSREDFNVASVGLGAGIKLRYQTRDLLFWVQAAEGFHFSSEGFRADNGFSAATTGEAVLLIRQAPVLDGLAVGYRFRLQTWSLSESRLNYRSLSHGLFVGVLF